MVCFCHIPMQSATASYAAMNLAFSPPKIPIQMNAALALGLGNSERLDLRLAAYMNSVRLPTVQLNTGLPSIKLAMGMFDLFDLPKLSQTVGAAFGSIGANVLPRLAFLTHMNITPILQLGLAARLSMQLDALKISPTSQMTGGANSFSIPKFALTPPKLMLGKMLAGLPLAFSLSESFGSFGAMKAHFAAMARIPMPKLAVSIPLVLRLAAVLEAILAIKAAFGVNAMTTAGLSAISAKLRLWASLPMPSPMPPLDLALKLPDVPSLPDVIAGAGMAPSGFSFQLPGIPIMLAINAVLALNATLKIPLGGCAGGACPFGG